MQIDWWTFALQTVNFLVLVWLLWRFLYRPVTDAIERRKALADEAFAEADKKKAEAEAARQRFEQDRAALAEERKSLLKQVHEDLADERKKIVEAAREDAAQLLEDARTTVAKEREAAWQEIREQAADVAAKLASAILQKVDPGALNGVILDQLEQQLAALPPGERDRLTTDLAADGGRLTVVTAAPLSSAEEDRWRTRLSDRLGLKNNTEFAVAAEILGGAELRFPHAALKLSWADQLQSAKERMCRDDDAS